MVLGPSNKLCHCGETLLRVVFNLFYRFIWRQFGKMLSQLYGCCVNPIPNNLIHPLKKLVQSLLCGTRSCI